MTGISRAGLLGSSIIGAFAAIFLLDLASPLGRAVPLLYIVPLVMSLGYRREGVVLFAAALGSGLAIVKYVLGVNGYLSVPVFDVDRSLGLFNRLMFIGTLWAAAVGLWWYGRAEQRARSADAVLLEKKSLIQLGEMATLVAHEVKNPLAGMAGVLQVIVKRLPSESPDRAIVKDVLARVSVLTASLNQMLLFARPRQPNFALVDIMPVMTAAADLLSQDANWSGVRLDISGEAAWVMGDHLLLGDAVTNLYLNAAQAMDGQGTINVDVREADGTVTVSVVDSGRGLPAAVQERAFEPFFTTKTRGAGLGLAIARRAVELHGGHISVDAARSTGAAFTITLPADRG